MTNDSVILNACTFFSRSSSRPSTLPGSARTPVGAPRRNATISASQFHEIHAVLLTLRCVSSVYYKRPAGPTQQDRVRRRINYQSLFLRTKTFEVGLTVLEKLRIRVFIQLRIYTSMVLVQYSVWKDIQFAYKFQLQVAIIIFQLTYKLVYLRSSYLLLSLARVHSTWYILRENYKYTNYIF